MENKLSYVKYDYDELVQQLKDRLRAKDVWKDTYASATGEMLIELFAYIANLTLYYVERRVEECYIGTAQNKSSVVNLVQLLNYSPKRNVSSTGSVVFSISSAVLGNVFIPKYTTVYTANSVAFVTTAEMTLNIGQTSTSPVTVIQGVVHQDSHYNQGNSSNLEITIESTQVENNTHDDISSLIVTVNGREWTQVSSFLNSGASDEHYVVRPELDDTLTIVFGDNLRGKIPSSSEEIIVTYIDSDGADGNVYEADKITTVNPTSFSYTYRLDDIDYTDTVTVTVTNPDPVTGGDNAEDIEEIRTEAPNVFRTGDRLVTKADFLAFLYNYPSIAEATVWGEYEEADGVADYDMFNRVKIVVLLESWQLVTTALQQVIEEDIYAKSMLTVKYEWIDPEIYNVVIVMDVIVENKYGLSATQAEIEDLLESMFLLGSTAKFNEDRRVSNLTEAVDALESVKYHHMTLEVREELTDDYASGVYGATLQSDTVKPETCKLYIGSDYAAIDVDRRDSSNMGDFDASLSGYTITGTIDYTTNEVLVDISPAPEVSVYVRYQQDADGDIVVSKNGICKLYTVDITSIAYES